MKTSITRDVLAQFAGPGHNAWIYDTRQRGLVLRVRPTGTHAYLVLLGRGQWYTLGRADVLTPEAARKLARIKLGEVADGQDPIQEKRRRTAATFGDFLDQHYRPWVLAHRKTGQQTLDRLAVHFVPAFGATPLDKVSAFAVERWRSSRLATGVRKATVNRDLNTLRGALTKAVEWQLLAQHPLRSVKQAQVDTIGHVRYLTAAEDARLREALLDRDTRRRAARETANVWRRTRGYDEWPAYRTYTDHLTPLVLLALNTGLRFGELTALVWTDVNLVRQLLTVRAEGAKSGLARYVPLNAEAVTVLRAWRPAEAAPAAYVFPGKREGGRVIEIKTAWTKLLKAAAITAFRFHDTRHTFASQLVMAGVDLNTVRELLGHADIKMTLRYAHLAPEHKAAAVAKIGLGKGGR